MPPPIIIIGIDGATLDFIRPWADEGKLPGFQSFLDGGIAGTLRSSIPPVTAPAWTSFMTGKNPGKHNLFDFIEHRPEGYEIQYTNSFTRRADTLWRILSDSGKKVGVMNVPMTYPPEEINGVFISGMDTPDELSDFVYPRPLREELEGLFGKIRLDIRHLAHMKNDSVKNKILAEFEELEENRKRIALYLIEKYDFDVFMVVFNSTDQVQHHFMHYQDKDHPQYDPAGSGRYGDAIFRVYKKIDDNLLEFRSRLGKDAVFMIMSDHGAGPVSLTHVYLNNYLEEIGVLKYRDSGKKGPSSGSGIRKVVRKIESGLRASLSSEQKMKLARLFPALRRKVESYLSLSGIDWEHTRAYSIEMMATSANIWVNMKGEKSSGTVEEKDYEGLIDFLVKKLYEMKDPEGRQVIRKVHRRADVFEGPYVKNAPDLIIDWWTGEGFLPKPSIFSEGKRICVTRNKEKFQPGRDWSGTHKINGVFMADGYPFKKTADVSEASITDIAPTVLYLAGVPVPDDMDGRVLTDYMDERFVASHPVVFTKGRDSGSGKPGENYSDAEAESIRERLKGLGYVE